MAPYPAHRRCPRTRGDRPSSGVVTTLVTVLASLAFLPALLRLLGDKVYAWKIPVLQIKDFNSDISLGGFWNWVTMSVMKHPAP